MLRKQEFLRNAPQTGVPPECCANRSQEERRRKNSRGRKFFVCALIQTINHTSNHQRQIIKCSITIHEKVESGVFCHMKPTVIMNQKNFLLSSH